MMHLTRLLLVALALLLTASPGLLSAKTFVIDAGHGDQDRGATVEGVSEKHLTLDTARRLAYILRNQGHKVIMTRDRGNFLTLGARSDIGNSYGDAIFVSVHYNYSGNTLATGVETYYYHESSQLLAAYVQAYILDSMNVHNRGVKSASFSVIRRTTRIPAILVECGFVSNASDRAIMCKGSYRQSVAAAIAKGLIAYTQAHP